ncbi:MULTISPECIES: putative ABC transporter permease [Clostridium]|uniref:putative ABC transporter permease n=1 Tax=Clostridium TaxID=1485 RepID=UPI0008240F57|nr:MULTISPECIES: putative ABC transporter permease [Clostridium]PJI09349.1 hypothetical protein CUB90_16335 [Clostridium sp. CT7]
MQNIMFFNISLYEAIFYFSIYAFLGWCLEVAYAAFKTGGFVNRGFLNGPVCPIYGFGIVMIIIILDPIRNNLVLLFIFAAIITSALEYLTGFVLQKAFHHRWWDYSNVPFNINGYICPQFSLIWGAAGVFVIKVVHPVIYDIVNLLPRLAGNIILAVIVISFLIDLCSAVQTVLKFNRRLKMIDEISNKMRSSSDALAEEISKNTIELKKIYNEDSVEFKKKHEAQILEIKSKYESELMKLKESYAKITAPRSILHRRIIKAFPNIKSTNYFEALEKLKDIVLK